MRPTYNNKTKKRRRSKNYKTQRKICDFGDIALFPYLFTRDLVLRSQKQRNKILKMFTCFQTDKFNISKYLAAIANISTYNLSAILFTQSKDYAQKLSQTFSIKDKPFWNFTYLQILHLI